MQSVIARCQNKKSGEEKQALPESPPPFSAHLPQPDIAQAVNAHQQYFLRK